VGPYCPHNVGFTSATHTDREREREITEDEADFEIAHFWFQPKRENSKGQLKEENENCPFDLSYELELLLPNLK